MKSGKQRKAEIKSARLRRAARSKAGAIGQPWRLPANVIACNPSQLAHYNSYGQPAFVQRGYYEDQYFRCWDCGASCVWKAERQKWWYEVAQGSVYSIAIRCAACRAAKREISARSRQAMQQQ
ncbi:zinc-ribbon domain containing protein [Viridibacterium curvum]|uniref:Probable zinc-binding domain-containing protein n=1 Tax=Viridibacterium curvum TaxID=1101404 RepID=A0ABP9QSM2_9RHOO